MTVNEACITESFGIISVLECAINIFCVLCNHKCIISVIVNKGVTTCMHAHMFKPRLVVTTCG